MDEQIADLVLLHESLKAKKFYGTLIETWKNGEVVLVKKEEIFQPRDFKILVEVRI